jgi:hypothetical protein
MGRDQRGEAITLGIELGGRDTEVIGRPLNRRPRDRVAAGQTRGEWEPRYLPRPNGGT